MAEPMNVAAMPKTASFQMRINPEIKQRAEEIFAHCGLTLTDAVNIFLQQSLNTGGLPFLVTQNSQQALHEQAVALLMAELKRGEDSVQSESDWVSEDEMLAEFAGPA